MRLTAGQSRSGGDPGSLGQTDPVEQFTGPFHDLPAAPRAEQPDRQDVVADRQRVEEIDLLKHETAVVEPEPCQLVFGHFLDVLAVEDDPAEARPVHARQGVQQRRLAGTGGPHHDREVGTVDLQIDVLQHMVLRPFSGERLRQLLGGDQTRHVLDATAQGPERSLPIS